MIIEGQMMEVEEEGKAVDLAFARNREDVDNLANLS